jgi:hypothetical protein
MLESNAITEPSSVTTQVNADSTVLFHTVVMVSLITMNNVMMELTMALATLAHLIAEANVVMVPPKLVKSVMMVH